MSRWRLVWFFGLIGLVLGSLSTFVAGKSHAVMQNGTVVAVTQSAPTTGAYVRAILQAFSVGMLFAAVGLVLTILIRIYRAIRARLASP